MVRTVWRGAFLCAFVMGYTGSLELLWPVLPMWVVAEGFEYCMHVVRRWDRMEARRAAR